MITLNRLKTKLFESCGYLDSFIYRDSRVIINEDLSISIDEEDIEIGVKSLEEAREYAKSYIDNSNILRDIEAVIPEEKIVSLISKYHDSIKITDKIVESYLDLASSNLFTIDPVLIEIKEKNSTLTGKIEHTLLDGSVVAIDEDTQSKLNRLLEDKYQIVEYMRESKENFMHVIRKIKE